MQPTPAGSFLKFLVGFLTLITMSFGLTFTVNKYSKGKSVEQAAAAAYAKTIKNPKK